MKTRSVSTAFLILSLPLAAGATSSTTSLHPEEAYPDDAPRMTTSPGPFSPMIEAAQWKLLDLGFDAGPINGDFGPKTQAALAQFQLANGIPVNGMLDDPTLAALGVLRPPKENP